MCYLSAPLWLLSLALSTVSVALQALVAPRYFIHPRQLFPIWPEWHRQWSLGLLLVTSVILFAPKVLGSILALARGSREFGGPVRLLLSALAEAVGSALFAPVRMSFHALFVPFALLGLDPEWRAPRRDDSETSWRRAAAHFLAPTLLGTGWAAGVYFLSPGSLWWFLPVVGALAVSIPIAVGSSRTSLGRRMRLAQVFAIPEETRPPLELRLMRQYLHRAGGAVRFEDVICDASLNAVARSVAAPRAADGPLLAAARRRVVAAGLQGPGALGARQRLLLLSDPRALAELHQATSASPSARARWGAEPGGELP
jgi:membrane glycosyltransferase